MFSLSPSSWFHRSLYLGLETLDISVRLLLTFCCSFTGKAKEFMSSMQISFFSSTLMSHVQTSVNCRSAASLNRRQKIEYYISFINYDVIFGFKYKMNKMCLFTLETKRLTQINAAERCTDEPRKLIQRSDVGRYYLLISFCIFLPVTLLENLCMIHRYKKSLFFSYYLTSIAF